MMNSFKITSISEIGRIFFYLQNLQKIQFDENFRGTDFQSATAALRIEVKLVSRQVKTDKEISGPYTYENAE